MYTEEDLRATFDALEREAPAEAGVLAGLARARRRRTVRRRTAVMFAAAMAAAAVVVGGTVVVPQMVEPADTVADPHFERWRFPFALDDIPGYRVSYQSPPAVWISKSDEAVGLDQYLVRVLPKGEYDPTADQAGEPVEVNGKHGFYRADMRCQCPSDIGVPGVVWEYAPDSWALVQYWLPAASPGATVPADVREVSLRFADAVRFDRTTAFRVPFRVGYLPAGLEAVLPPTNDTDPHTLNRFTLMVAMGGKAGTLTISAYPQHLDTGEPHAEPTVTTEPISGGPAVMISFDDVAFSLTSEGISTDELNRIASSITPAADQYDTTTWFDAEKAIPLH